MLQVRNTFRHLVSVSKKRHNSWELVFFFFQNGCMYVGCGESHADHSTMHSQVRVFPWAFTSHALRDSIGHSYRSVLDLTQSLYRFNVFICIITELTCAFFVFFFFFLIKSCCSFGGGSFTALFGGEGGRGDSYLWYLVLISVLFRVT